MWEIKIGTNYRVYFNFTDDNSLVLLHGGTKSTQEDRELYLANIAKFNNKNKNYALDAVERSRIIFEQNENSR